MAQKNSRLISWLPTERTCDCPTNAINCLSERAWLRNQVPIWWFSIKESNTKFDAISRKKHPAVFPSALAKRVISNYTHENETVLDIFSGVGTTLYSASTLNRNAIGIELNENFTAFTARRLRLIKDNYCSDNNSTHTVTRSGHHTHQINTDSRRLLEYLPPKSVDLVFTSPPYWDLLKQRPSQRNLKGKKYLKTNYSEDVLDLSNEPTLEAFTENIEEIFKKVYTVLNSGGHCVVNTGDYRKSGKFISLSTLYIDLLRCLNFELNNVIIWDRRREYEIGIFSYPSKFIVNNGMFEYLLEFKKM